MAVVDLDSGEAVGTVDFPIEWTGWASPSGDTNFWSRGMPHAGAVDEDTGRLFVAYAPNGQVESARQFAAGNGCFTTGPGTQGRYNCLAGYHIIDGRTLEVTGQLPLSTLRIDGMAVAVVPRATSFVSSASDGGKLLALVIEVVAHTPADGNDYRAGKFELQRTFLVQWDVASRRQEWSMHVEDCRSAREADAAMASAQDGVKQRTNPAAIIPTDQAIWVACTSDYAQAGVMVRIPLDANGMPTSAMAISEYATPDVQEPGSEPPMLDSENIDVFRGPERVAEFWADPPSQRVLMRVLQSNPDGEVWYVFDGVRRGYLGAIGTGKNPMTEGSVGIDTVSGRFYVLHQEGLYVADIRRTPLAQALFFSGVASSPYTAKGWPLAIDTGSPKAPRRVIYPLGERKPTGGIDPLNQFGVIEDHFPVTVEARVGEERRTLDLVEAGEITTSTWDGAARGYGARALLIGGAEAATRLRFIDVGGARALYDHITKPPPGQSRSLPPRDPCLDQDREVVLGFVGPRGAAVVDGAGARGTAVPVVLDGTTVVDLERPVSRCTRRDWETLWSTALFGRPPVGEAGVPASLRPAEAECLQGAGDPGTQPAAVSGDPAGPFYAQVRCEEGEAGGFGYARGGAPGLSVAEAISSFRIYRDSGRGIVARVESVARGISVAGLVTIQSVRGVAESWANGRQQPVAGADQENGYTANCDMDRTAGTCFHRHIFGVVTPGYSCGPCGDERAFMDGMNRAFRSDALVRFRQPDNGLAAGSEDGFTAAITKPQPERFADLTLNGDTLQTVVPSLEIVHYAAPFRPIGEMKYGPTAGRQIYQFAGVEVSSSYSIQCLLVYDEATNTCAAAKETPGSLALELTTSEGKPLAGGAFELRADTDEDGVVGLVDKLVPEGACVTADDGVGTCKWDDLAPGKYVVTQVTAPPGYSPVSEPYAVELVSGEARTVTFTNVSNVSVINVSATDEADKPLSGAKFAVFADPDADGKVAADAEPAAQCETGADGTCSMSVPVGSYVLVQLAAPGGLEPIEPVAFVLTAGGETAAVTVVNYPPDLPAPPPSAGQVDYLPPAPPPPPQLHAVPLPVAGIPMDDEPEIAGPGIGGTIVRVVQAPGDVLRLLARDPVQAAAFAATLLLLTLAWAGVQRRRRLVLLTEDLSG